MQHFHFYADMHSIDFLGCEGAKAVLIGSDFGYGNFGDLLQHMGSIDRVKRATSLSVVSVLSLDAISRHVGVSELRLSYGVDAQMFVSSEPLSVERAEQLGLERVRTLRNVACIQLYGGGFLNEMWGGFVLQVTEYFLRNLPNAAYYISGQQISKNYSSAVQTHINKFRPQLVGVRDRESLETMLSLGAEAHYSFDDAVEPLQELSKLLTPQCAATGAFLHLNSSGYTGNSAEIEEISAHMRLLSGRSGSSELVLFQAFQDSREEVIDSMETLKRLEGGLPFVDLNMVMLVSCIMKGGEALAPAVLKGEYGYVCSYHVTLWLQLNGIPCWLRSSNPYYDQKRRSLGVEGTFESFLEHLPKVDHSLNLEERAAWTRMLESRLSELSNVENTLEWNTLDHDVVRRSFSFKGEPRMETRLSECWAAVCGLKDDIERLNAELLSTRVMRDETAHDNVRLTAELKNSQALWHKTAAGKQLLKDRLEAYQERLTTVGAEARQYREQAEHEHVQWLRACEAERNASARLQSIVKSRSWTWTRPIRALTRFVKTKRFDAEGTVGMFELARRMGAKLPLPPSVKSRLARILQSLRRR